MNLQNDFTTRTSLDEVWTCLDVDFGAVSHQGFVRDSNQDTFLVMKFGRSLENLMTNLDEDLFEQNYAMSGYGMVVADGMGGMAAGDVASRLALTKLIELIIDTSDWTLALQRQKDITTVLERMTERFLQIDDILRREADHDQTLHGMGTTLTVAGALGSNLILGHVGDSRAYLLHEDKFTQLTTDHTLAQALIDAGVAHPDDPASRSMRHVLTAAVGSLGEQVDPQVQRFKLRGGDKLLLCTDGLTEMVDDETIAQALREAKSAQDICQDLIDLSLSSGGTDNVTVVLAHFRSSLSPR
ncbi:MAG TPA: protein phosphatase 2C domain-containing protein [Pyrinomonadaceae bacterium]|nr:protein phosphatase 2C domain-containing protein [Pyrinomonadaceae bacterium]